MEWSSTKEWYHKDYSNSKIRVFVSNCYVRSLSHFEVQLTYISDISYVISCVGCLKLRKMYTVHVRCTWKNIIGRGHMAQRVSFNPSKSMPYLKKNLPRNAKHLLSLYRIFRKTDSQISKVLYHIVK